MIMIIIKCFSLPLADLEAEGWETEPVASSPSPHSSIFPSPPLSSVFPHSIHSSSLSFPSP